jgi:hypothetical protein
MFFLLLVKIFLPSKDIVQVSSSAMMVPPSIPTDSEYLLILVTNDNTSRYVVVSRQVVVSYWTTGGSVESTCCDSSHVCTASSPFLLPQDVCLRGGGNDATGSACGPTLPALIGFCTSDVEGFPVGSRCGVAVGMVPDEHDAVVRDCRCPVIECAMLGTLVVLILSAD